MDKFFSQSPEQLDGFLDFIDEDLENVRRVVRFCRQETLDVEFRVHAKSETARESAEKLDVDLQQIVKTLVFITGGDPVAVLCPGDSRVDEQKLRSLTGGEVRMARPREVEDATGYVVGGVSPFDLNIPVYMEESILEHEKVKPAAGSRVVGALLDPEDLKEITEAETLEIVE